MVQKVSDAKKLEINKDQFIGKPFKVLLDQIGPEIKFVYGSPDNKGNSITGTAIKFFFVDKNEYWKKKKEKQKQIGVLVSFRVEFNNTRKPIPVGGTNRTTEALAKEYGDMIVKGIYISEED